MPEAKEQCVKPARGPISTSPEPLATTESVMKKEARIMTARVGKPAPDFEAGAYVAGSFKNVRLSDYKGKWVVLCFYPGDFTFV